MTFLEAIRKSLWVRRPGWGDWLLVKDNCVTGFRPPRPLTRADLLAADWEAHHCEEGLEEYLRSSLPENTSKPESSDDSATRFGLLELD